MENPTPAGARSHAEVARGAVEPGFWRARRVLVTGHTGFKGAWLSLWLQLLGARVTGFSLGVPTEPSLYELARVAEGMASDVALDIRDRQAVVEATAEARPEIVIHLAAQPLVRRSFLAPSDTYETNVMGTLNVLEAVRACDTIQAVVIVSSDKCYENREWHWPYRESDPLGGHDPYSSSKAAAEILTSSYRRSFFSDPAGPRIATARAGNVIGGGDWAPERLLADIVNAARAGSTLRLRNPSSIRPWQHVLCPLSGYLMLAQALCDSSEHARAWNFGPDDRDARTVEWIVGCVSELWPGGLRWEHSQDDHPHEATYLKLDSSRARSLLGWRSPMGLDEALQATVGWYRGWLDGRDMRELTRQQIAALH